MTQKKLNIEDLRVMFCEKFNSEMELSTFYDYLFEKDMDDENDKTELLKELMLFFIAQFQEVCDVVSEETENLSKDIMDLMEKKYFELDFNQYLDSLPEVETEK